LKDVTSIAGIPSGVSEKKASKNADGETPPTNLFFISLAAATKTGSLYTAVEVNGNEEESRPCIGVSWGGGVFRFVQFLDGVHFYRAIADDDT
jgi:hypothetical protein